MADQKISQLTTATTPLVGTEVLPIVQSSTTKKVSVANLTVGRATEASTLLLNGTDNQYVLAAGANKGLEIGTDGTTAVLLSYNRGTAAYKRLGHNALDFIWSLSGTEALSLSTAANFRIATGNLVIGTSGKGIDFSATAGAGTSELLNDYEEGTFTPVVADADTGGNTATGTFTGNYTKIGRIVHVTLQLVNIDTTGMTAGNNLIIRGLPFTAVTFNQYPCPISWANLTTGGNIISGSVLGATASLYLVTSLNGASNGYIKVSAATSGSCGIAVNVTYQV